MCCKQILRIGYQSQEFKNVLLLHDFSFLSGNAGDEKNLRTGGRKFIFFNRFSGDILFSFFIFICFFLSLFSFCCLFFEIKNIYSYTHSTMRAGQ